MAEDTNVKHRGTMEDAWIMIDHADAKVALVCVCAARCLPCVALFCNCAAELLRFVEELLAEGHTTDRFPFFFRLVLLPLCYPLACLDPPPAPPSSAFSPFFY